MTNRSSEFDSPPRRLGALETLSGPILLGLFLLLGCSRGGAMANSAPAGAPEAAAAPIAEVRGNPFEGVEFFVPPYTNADQTRRRLERDNPADAALIAKIADTPQARWFGEWSGEIETVAGNYVKAAHNRGKAALLVAYNVPNRDCGQYSAGGAEDPEQYRAWIRGLAAGITASRRAVVILEPDALAHIEECLSPEDQQGRLALIADAVEVLEALPGVAVYIDAGHSRWVPADKMAERLRKAGIAKARGFSLNVSNYIGDEELITYGDQIVGLIGDTHYVIDSSRNGNGPAEGNQWCNPAGRALGRKPTTETGNPRLDAYIWVKNPGESDGECEGGPPAGQWFGERALEMARGAAY